MNYTLKLAVILTIVVWMWRYETIASDYDSGKNSFDQDFIVVGAGTAGCIVATRLAEHGYTVLLLEAGSDPPEESKSPGKFLALPQSDYDWKFKSEYDHYFARHTEHKVAELTSGKVLGGSGSLNHLIYSRGHEDDYDLWAEAANDLSWKSSDFDVYFSRFQEAPNSKVSAIEGYIKLTKEPTNVTKPYLNAFQEMGHRKVLDTNEYNNVGYTEPLLFIGDGIRQSSAQGFLKRKTPYLNLMKEMLVTKIVFDGWTAIGVEAVDKNNSTYMFYADFEVIVCAGALNTPKLLMLSGIGPKDHLEALGIEVVLDLPVGENLLDHQSLLLVHKMGPSSNFTELDDPHKFPTPLFISNARVDNREGRPDYQTLNLIFPDSSKKMFGVCSKIFFYEKSICETFRSETVDSEALLTIFNVLHPKSKGEVKLRSTDPYDAPIVYMGSFSDKEDINDAAICLEHWIKIQESTFFKEVNAKLVDLKLPKCKRLKGLDFWKCYALEMGNTMWHYSGTCAMGSVVDNYLQVFGVSRLRVVDASIIPELISGGTCGPVMAIAEKAVDLILDGNGPQFPFYFNRIHVPPPDKM